MRGLFTYFFLLLFFSGFTQKNTVTIVLLWEKSNPQFFSDTGKKQTLYFQNAYYDDEQLPDVPFFKIKIPLNDNERIRNVYLSDILYSTLIPDEETTANAISDKIPVEITPETGTEISGKSLIGVISFLPFRKNTFTEKIEKVIKANLNYEITYVSEKNSSAHSYTQNSVLASGTWYKFKVKDNGIYKITYDDLVKFGIDPVPIDPKNIRIYGNGSGMLPESNLKPNNDDLIENAIYVKGEVDGHFDPDDYILFYGQSPVTWKYDATKKLFTHAINYYSDETCYFLTYDSGPGKRILTQNSSDLPATTIITKFNDYEYHEKDSLNLIKSGKEWYGEYFSTNNNSHNFNFQFPDIDNHSKAVLKINIAAQKSSTSTQFNILAEENVFTLMVSPVSGSSNADYAKFSEDTMSFFPLDSNMDITINEITPGAIGWLNFIDINVIRNLHFKSPMMNFRNTGCVGAGNITEFRMSNSNDSIIIWDITDPFNIKEQQYFPTDTGLRFLIPTDSLREFVAFDNSQFLPILFHGKIQNQNLHAIDKADMIIITYPDFISQANRLALIHATLDTFTVTVVTPQEIYNEFSSGSQDISAIRNFIRMLYDRSPSKNDIPKYLLLFGDGSYDYKNRIPGNTNYIPTYQSFNSLTPTSSYVTDDFFGLLDSTEGSLCTGALDIGIGRIPVKSIEEAKAIVDKIESYLSKKSTYSETNDSVIYSKKITGDWRNIICFIGDDEDNNMHIKQADELATHVDTMYNNFNIDKIYLDAYMQITGPNGALYPDVNKTINYRVQKGALLVNFTGHGGEKGLAHEKVLQISDINKWENITNMPAFMTATCEFSRFDNPDLTSAGELIFLNPKGGGIALFTTTRLAFSNSNFNLNKSLYKFVFKTVNNEYYRLGDLIRLSKIDNGSIVNIRNFVLLGDPALRLSYPENTVVTTDINGHPPCITPDTLKALSNVTISGIIQNRNGQKLSDFNGTIYPTVYDKKYTTTTLKNDPQSYDLQSPPLRFSQQNHVLYRGQASVTNGEFSFSFTLPIYMNNDYGIGRISYYAQSEHTDANGYFENPYFIIGGIDSEATTDNTGPSVKLFLNDTTFLFGDTTDVNPLLLAYINDSNGLFIADTYFGHTITAIMDSNTNNTIELNDYYMQDMDTYRSGTVLYPLKALTEGRHTLSLKAWDSYNNSTEAYTEFVVAKKRDSDQDSGFSLKNIYNFPNPFTANTRFYFEYNPFSCEFLDVKIDIYTSTGVHVKTLSQTVQTSSSNSIPIVWNGCSNSGEILNSGIYLYHIKVKTPDGVYLESSNKLILLK